MLLPGTQCEHLRSNWYSTAGDVAQMSKVWVPPSASLVIACFALLFLIDESHKVPVGG
jgi:hypothetical protein